MTKYATYVKPPQPLSSCLTAGGSVLDLYLQCSPHPVLRGIRLPITTTEYHSGVLPTVDCGLRMAACTCAQTDLLQAAIIFAQPTA